MIANIFQNFTAFIDGRGMAGLVDSATLPKPTPLMQEYSAGGMSAPIDIPMGGHEKLEAEVTLKGYQTDVLRMWSVTMGATIPLIIRGALVDDDGVTHAVAATMRGVIKELDFGEWKMGEEATLKIGMSLRYFKYEHDGNVLFECDPVNMVHVVDGVDQLAAQRLALGV